MGDDNHLQCPGPPPGGAFELPPFPDVLLTFDDGDAIRSHRSALSAAAAVFRDLFESVSGGEPGTDDGDSGGAAADDGDDTRLGGAGERGGAGRLLERTPDRGMTALPLHGVSAASMLLFLQQIYYPSCMRSPITQDSFEPLLLLGNRFDAPTVVDKVLHWLSDPAGGGASLLTDVTFAMRTAVLSSSRHRAGDAENVGKLTALHGQCLALIVQSVRGAEWRALEGLDDLPIDSHLQMLELATTGAIAPGRLAHLRPVLEQFLERDAEHARPRFTCKHGNTSLHILGSSIRNSPARICLLCWREIYYPLIKGLRDATIETE